MIWIDCQEVRHDCLTTRQALFFDTNIWIDLVENTTPVWRHLAGMLKQLVKARVVFCPLATPTIWELYRQPPACAPDVAQLMDTLSLRTAFANRTEIFRAEVRNFVLGLVDRQRGMLSPREVYVPVAHYLSTRLRLVFPNSYTGDEREAMTAAVTRRLGSVGVENLVSWRKNSTGLGRESIPPYSAARKSRRAQAGSSRTKARNIEAEFVYDRHIEPALQSVMRSLSVSTRAQVMCCLASIEPDREGSRIEALLEKMPALRNAVDLYTIAGFDPERKDRRADFFDIEMLIAPFAYADVFVSQDRWIRHLIHKDLADRNQTAFVEGPEELTAFLEQIGKASILSRP
ncbi:MAG: hypothetical protein WD733_08800 [Bryobacterales bacterium]